MSPVTLRTIVIAGGLLFSAAGVFGFMVYQVYEKGAQLEEYVSLIEKDLLLIYLKN